MTYRSGYGIGFTKWRMISAGIGKFPTMTEIPRNWCLLQDTGRELTAFIEGGEIRTAPAGNDARNLLESVKDFACFTNQPKAIMGVADARHFVTRQRRERILDIRFDETTKIASLPPLLSTFSPYDYAMAFATYCEWLQSLGITFTKRRGWGTLGRYIWRVTDGEHKFRGPKQGRLAFYGGRKQAPYPITFREAQHFDITAAYLHALGSLPIPGRLRPSPLGEWRITDLDGIAWAKVTIPHGLGEWNPLPVRADKRSVRMLSFPSGQIEGMYPFSELRMARDYGCKVEIVESWAAQNTRHYFSQWFSTMVAGRSLPNGASAFAKQHANLLWSSFATSPTRVTWKTYKDEYGHQPRILKEQLPGRDFNSFSSYVAAIVAARNRQRLFTEVLCPGGVPNLYVIFCDTDGFISGTKTQMPKAISGNGASNIGGWRFAGYFPSVEIRSPNAYRYTCLDCGRNHSEWHYVCAGASNVDTARNFFKRQPRTGEAVDLDSINVEQLPYLLENYKPQKRARRVTGASVPSF